MTISKFTTTILKATGGFVLTQSDESINPEDRIFASELALGANDAPENWIEISNEKAGPLKEAQQQAMETAMIKRNGIETR